VYCVKVSENDYCSSISSCVTVDVDSPVRTMGSLSPAEMKEWAVKVIDLNGQTLMYEQITTTDDTSIDINTLEEGTYLLRVVNKTNTDTPAPVKAVKVKN
ncbi:MAG: T9SS type A sorting domain-containing protein, partial [bacterium]|nr:T9SS type A sorting domain-containing protein [bacterium]